MKVNNFMLVVFGLLFTIASLNATGTTKEVVEDSVITTSVKTKLLADRDVSGLKVSVTTQNGVVYLSGRVKKLEEACKAIEIASSTSGVVDVNLSDLKIDGSNTAFEDAFITAKVRGVFLKEKLLGDKMLAISGIHIATKDGVVYLEGKVENTSQLKLAEDLAKSVNGVKKVDSSLTVDR